MNAWVLARSDRPRSWRFFTDALACDLHDVHGGTTAEGLHLGAMAGTIDLVQRRSTGLETRQGMLRGRTDPRQRPGVPAVGPVAAGPFGP